MAKRKKTTEKPEESKVEEIEESEVEESEVEDDELFDDYLDEDDEDEDLDEDSDWDDEDEDEDEVSAEKDEDLDEDSDWDDEDEDGLDEDSDWDDEDLDEESDVDDLDEESDADEADDHSDHDDHDVELVDDLAAASTDNLKGVAVYFDDPRDLLHAALETNEQGWKKFEAFSPFPIHGMDDAVGGRSWLPWVTFFAGGTGFLLANLLQFGTLTFDWPMIIGGKPHAPWPSFVPVMFELTVFCGGHITALVMFIAAGCFRKNWILDKGITRDRFVLWLSAEDERFDKESVREFATSLHPYWIRPVYNDE